MSSRSSFLGAQNFQVLGDAPLDLGQFVEDLLPLHAGEALQLQLDDGLRLLLGELRTRAISAVARFAWALARRADQADHFVQVVERLLESEQDVLALARFAQHVVGAAADHIDAVLDEAA